MHWRRFRLNKGEIGSHAVTLRMKMLGRGMAAASEGRGADIDGDPPPAGLTITHVIVTRAVAVPLYMGVARVPEPEPIVRQGYACPQQDRRSIFLCIDDQERGLLQRFSLFARKFFRRRVFRHLSLPKAGLSKCQIDGRACLNLSLYPSQTISQVRRGAGTGEREA